MSVTVVSGFHEPPEDWTRLPNKESEIRNAISIVMRLEYKDKSILFTGDVIGRHRDGADDECIAAEKFMVEGSEPIDSDVMIVPHHGGNNASSTKLIKAVSPEFVIFSAGHRHDHPRAVVAKRYIRNGVDRDKMFRTDLGDDGGVKEWDYGRIPGHKDPKGDDDVDILIRPDGEIVVEYRNN